MVVAGARRQFRPCRRISLTPDGQCGSFTASARNANAFWPSPRMRTAPLIVDRAHTGTDRACPHLPEGEGAKARSCRWDAGLPSCAVRPGTATSDTSGSFLDKLIMVGCSTPAWGV